MSLAIGIDLAQARDRTALAAVAAYFADTPSSEDEETPRKKRRTVRHHDLVHLEKLRPGLAYPAQAEALVSIAESLATDEQPTLWVDATGVGRAVVDLIRAASPFPVKAVTLTSATEAVAKGSSVSVPKAELVSTLEVVLSTRRLHAAPDLPLADDLRGELGAFGYEMSPTGRPLYEGKGSHDDLVIAVALGVYGGERRGLSGAEFVGMMRESSEILAERRGGKAEP